MIVFLKLIVFPFEYEKDTYYIKRIIGLPGETVRIDYDGNIYINELTEPYYSLPSDYNLGETNYDEKTVSFNIEFDSLYYKGKKKMLKCN